MSGITTEFGTRFQKYLNGEIRVDGFQSPWLIDQLRRRAEDALKPRPIVKAKQIIEQQVKPQIQASKPAQREKLPKQPRQTCPYTGCGNPINKNTYGICSRHLSQFRGLLNQTEVRVCAEDGCFNVMLKNCTLTRCRTHAKDERRAIEAQRQRARRLAA